MEKKTAFGEVKPNPIKKTAFDAMKLHAQQIGFGEWVIKLVIYNGKITGFDQVQAPLIKFREQKEK